MATRLSTAPIKIRIGCDDGCDECRKYLDAGDLVIVYSGNPNFFCSESCYQARWAREWALREAIARANNGTPNPLTAPYFA